ncbi:gamma-glutamyltransferase [Acuticoccus sp. I52.16.1]|uniref:gamma-glutamyltransferase n=1 Tax=Acuticoccus sp. I52.16.1 TaxID=2928472 RepID=UPI001FD17C72|nr:gamma-glutamyltransferase [Acuticoccus sp. I52.16.1]UOM32951.1 gamma-glutamyltransferase [Acuticoccus sp. I52.16.1]
MSRIRRLDRLARGAPLRVLAGAAAVVLTLAPAGAQDAMDGQRFVPVRAETHMVVSQERQASEVGREIMRRGGNAVDAAVATAFALAVTLPRAGNIGGGGFMIVHMAASGETVAIDSRETAPAAATPDMFLDARGEADPELSRRSGLAVGVPGTVAGLALAHERYGSGALTFAELVAPAVTLAREGFEVGSDTAAALAHPSTTERLLADPQMAAAYYPGGAAPSGGDRLTLPALADTLEAIADGGPEAFYGGEIAQGIVDAVGARGGRMTLEDLAGYEAKVREPVRGTFKDYEVLSMPPPSSGGVHLVQMLNTLERQPFGTYGLNSADMIHVMAEAAKYAYADRAVYLGDPDFVDVPVAALTSKEYARQIEAKIDLDVATPSEQIAADPGALPRESNETTHFSVIDEDGNAVSMTTTLNFSFGVGFGTRGGFLLNNELDDFSAKPGVPNAYGLVGGEANAVGPVKRPLSSMTPTILLKDGDVSLVTGSPGGSRIITTVLQVILNATVHERNIATATNAPRVHHQWLPDYIRIEEGINHDTIRLLEEKGHDVRIMSAMGSAQSIQVGPEGALYGASDPRRPGGAAVGD